MAARTSASSLLKSLKTTGGSKFQVRAAHSKGYIATPGQQAHPLCGFYDAHLAYKPAFARVDPPGMLPEAKPAAKKVESPAPPPPPPPPKAEAAAKTEAVKPETPAKEAKTTTTKRTTTRKTTAKDTSGKSG